MWKPILAGGTHGRNRTPSNLYTPCAIAENQRKPSEVCVIANMPAGREPSCIRQDVCMYWVRRLFGSRAWTAPARNNTQARHEPRVTAIAAQAHIKRSRSDRREAVFPMFVAEQSQTVWSRPILHGLLGRLALSLPLVSGSGLFSSAAECWIPNRHRARLVPGVYRPR